MAALCFGSIQLGDFVLRRFPRKSLLNKVMYAWMVIQLYPLFTQNYEGRKTCVDICETISSSVVEGNLKSGKVEKALPENVM